jgi:hypothetical protein
MQRHAVAPDIQALGAGIDAFVEGFGAFNILASRVLHDVGIGKLDDAGMIQLDKAAWYPAGAILRAFARIEQQLGGGVIYKMGLTIPRHAIFPLDVREVEAALRSIEVAYHMNHGRGGEPLIDLATGLVKEGIGHYRVRREGERRLVIECENPYPCDLDRGIVETVAKRFQPDARVVHSAQVPCRKQGADFCALVVEW